MSYNAVTIFPSGDQTIVPKSDSDVDLYVVRSNLFGSRILGNRGLYHTGLMFQSQNSAWVIDLAINNNFSSLIPYLNDEGEVSTDNSIIIEYYSPDTQESWKSYWKYKSSKICTLSPQLYDKLIDYILKELAPKYDRYILFSISNKPLYNISGKQDIMVSEMYSADNTCDKLPMRCFEWLQKNHNVKIQSFPITRIVLSVDQNPIPITDMKDPGLVEYTRKIQNYKEIFSKIHSKDPSSMISLYEQHKLMNNDYFNILEYVLSLDNKTYKPQWYKLPTNDVSISAEDMYFRIPQKNGRWTLIIIIIIALLILSFFLFNYMKK